ncbi:zinc-dependent alcohol dehydrogenase [Pyrobaculum calidifontis]|uniref:Alcohol dehydrogenase GroES domain protein n=1 Tax=Pyrobaculum calidifontis (strain DSM 21063 / JCM 11548 / VA1) TaxID=410359 RepID=A3MVR8_PYRCJ|nr:zinc-dependent alcohol dehydrogenase [Pyrobaculum calidifontis]ABO08735.1 Alcohol dehydrogenase GroES domain protein [Pyrobaculum calidifontis JCM 11548]
MRAAVIKEWGTPLEVTDVPKPEPGPGEVLVRISASGVCHTDIHQWKGDWPPVQALMIQHGVRILGHEGIGVVEEVGLGVSTLKKGDRVGVPWMNYWCGRCEYCLSGYPHWCPHAKYTSVHVDGTHAEYAIISERATPRIPKEISDVEAAPLMCAGVTAYGAVRKLITEAAIPPGKPIAIIGAAGGLGHYAVQIAKAFGYTVVGIDVGAERVKFVEKLGADYAVDVGEADKFVMDKWGGVYASVVFTPRLEGYRLGLRLLRPLGALVFVGLPDMKEGGLELYPLVVVGRGIRIFGSSVGVTHEFEELFNLVVQGKVKSHVTKTASLSEINEVFKDLEEGKIVGRAVLKI